MTEIAQELDKKLKSLDTTTASSLERLVRDALELVERQPETGLSVRVGGRLSLAQKRERLATYSSRPTGVVDALIGDRK